MKNLIQRYPELSVCEQSIRAALELIVDTYKAGGKVLVCGNRRLFFWIKNNISGGFMPPEKIF